MRPAGCACGPSGRAWRPRRRGRAVRRGWRGGARGTEGGRRARCRGRGLQRLWAGARLGATRLAPIPQPRSLGWGVQLKALHSQLPTTAHQASRLSSHAGATALAAQHQWPASVGPARIAASCLLPARVSRAADAGARSGGAEPGDESHHGHHAREHQPQEQRCQAALGRGGAAAGAGALWGRGARARRVHPPQPARHCAALRSGLAAGAARGSRGRSGTARARARGARRGAERRGAARHHAPRGATASRARRLAPRRRHRGRRRPRPAGVGRAGRAAAIPPCAARRQLPCTVQQRLQATGATTRHATTHDARPQGMLRGQRIQARALRVGTRGRVGAHGAAGRAVAARGPVARPVCVLARRAAVRNRVAALAQPQPPARRGPSAASSARFGLRGGRRQHPAARTGGLVGSRGARPCRSLKERQRRACRLRVGR
jgi:hypothetical protein